LASREFERGAIVAVSHSHEPSLTRENINPEERNLSEVYSNHVLADRINQLERQFIIIDEQRRFRNLLNPSASKEEPFHRWARYREAYSGTLVKELIQCSNLDSSHQFVFDPMCGSGSTLVASAQMAFDCVGSDVNPYAIDLSNAKLVHYSPEAVRVIEHFMTDSTPRPGQKKLESWSTSDEMRQYFEPQHLEELRDIYNDMAKITNPSAKHLLFVAWLTILEDCSNRQKGGNGLITRNTKVRSVWSHFNAKVRMFLDDICNNSLPEKVAAYARKCSVFQASSLVEEFRTRTQKELGAVIFSPPYANSFDYFESYKLELLGGYYDIAALAEARKSAIRNYRKGYGYRLSTDDELVQMLCNEVSARIPGKEAKTGKVDNRSRLVPNLLVGYFDDMRSALNELDKCMPPGSHCHIVVNQSSYLGVIIPTDIVLAYTARRTGFDVSQIICCGKATTSAQQLREYPYLAYMLRESIVSLRKRPRLP